MSAPRPRPAALARAAGLAPVLALAVLGACDPEPARPQAAAPAPPAAPPAPPAQTGVASYFGPKLAGQQTASGETVKPGALTAASRSLPLGTTAKVTNTRTGRSVQVKVTDRGPYAKGRILDVSPQAAHRLGMKDDGVAPVKVQPLAPRPAD